MKKVLVNFIQDRSGSMQSVWQETLSGFKTFVQKLKEEKDVDYVFSLTTFDTLVETPLIAVPLEQVTGDELAAHGPRGSTALYDAVGATIANTDKDRHGAEKIICIIVTDGQENSSREWDKDKLNQSVESHLNAGDWTFTYLGTQPETWDDAGRFGVPAGSTMSYTPAMAQATYATMSASVNALSKSAVRGSSAMNDFTPDHVAHAVGMKKTAGRPISKPIVPKPSTPKSKSNKKWR